jgi:lysophospholipase L1-like esterase
MTPFYLEPNALDRMRSRMDEFGGAAKRVAEWVGASFVDTQAAFASHFDYVHPTLLASDRVHPNLTGHLLIAGALLEALGFDWSRMRSGN